MTGVVRRECILKPLNDYSAAEKETPRLYDTIVSSDISGKGYSGLKVADRWQIFASKEGERELVCLISGECADTLLLENSEAIWAGLACTAKAFGMDSAWVVSDLSADIPESYLGIAFKSFSIEHSLNAGEETLVFAKMEESIPITRPQPPFPVEKGLFGRPTLIHSAEFFAHIPYILLGQEVNTKLCRLCGDVENIGVAEVVLGTPVREILSFAGATDIKAVQFGGINGVFLSEDELDLAYGYESAREKGFAFGDGSLRVMNRDHCIAFELYKSLGEAYRCSCGRCVFCREGLYQLYLLMEDVVKGKASDGDLNLIRDISEVIKDNAGCDYGKMTADMVCSGFKRFYEEIEAHIRSKCPALACPGMFTVHILPDKCKGCGECVEKCPVSAIAGGAGLIHVINQSECTQCAECMPCREKAIVRAGLQKPSTPDHPIPVGTFVQKKKGLQKRTI